MILDELDPECGADGDLPLSLFEAFATYPFEGDLAQLVWRQKNGKKDGR